MWKAILAAALTLAVTVPALAQSEEEVRAAADKQISAWTGCLRDHLQELAKADREASDKQVIARANLACPGERKAVWQRFQEAPLAMSPDEATRQLDEALEYIQPAMQKTISEARQG